MFTELTDLEWEIVRHKLEAARAVNKQIADNLSVLEDGLEFDYPFVQRNADFNAGYGSRPYVECMRMERAIHGLSVRIDTHLAMASEFMEMARW